VDAETSSTLQQRRPKGTADLSRDAAMNCVPTNSSLLRLNVGIGRIGHIEGLPDIRPDGRFLIVWRFDRGQGVIHPWFSVGTLSDAAFPYAPGTSKRVIVTLGERTPVCCRSGQFPK
jgi:hypothetical protein